MSTMAVPMTMATKTRISVSLDAELVKEFDKIAGGSGLPTRSRAVDEAMRLFVSGKKWDLASKGTVPGVILLTYDHHARDVNRALTELQHDFGDVVTATMHIHLSKHTCLEVIAFKGAADKVRALAKGLQSQKGVLDLKLITSPT